MNHRRQLAAALACAMAVGLCAGHVFADGTADPVEIVDTPEIIAPADPAPESTESPEAEVSEESSSADAPLSQPAGLAALSSRKAFIVEGEPVSPDIPLSERQDPEGTVSFENLEARMRENNLNILALDENIESIEAIDLKAMHGSLTQAIWMLESQQKKARTVGGRRFCHRQRFGGPAGRTEHCAVRGISDRLSSGHDRLSANSDRHL